MNLENSFLLLSLLEQLIQKDEENKLLFKCRNFFSKYSSNIAFQVFYLSLVNSLTLLYQKIAAILFIANYFLWVKVQTTSDYNI